MFRKYASNERYTWRESLIQLLKAPWLLVWGPLKFLTNLLLGRLMSWAVLPATFLSEELLVPYPGYFQTQMLLFTAQNNERRTSTNTVLNVPTFDGANLLTYEARDNDFNPATGPYIIHFCGNSQRADGHLRELIEEAQTLKATSIAFNYRGVGASRKQPTSTEHLVIDGIAQVQRVLDQRVSPGQIILHGLSIGGAVATLVAKHFYDKGIRVRLYNDRSFSVLSAVPIAWLRISFTGARTGHTESLLGKILGWIAWPVVKLIFVLSDWEMEPAKAFAAIPSDYREYQVVRSSKNNRDNAGPVDDLVIPHNFASLHESAELTRERKDLKALLNRCEAALNAEENSPSLLYSTHELIAAARTQLKGRKVQVSELQINGHIVPPTMLFSRGRVSRNGFEVFRDFVEASRPPRP